jgi:hypothetical protein
VPLSVFHRLDLSIRLPKRLPRALAGHEMRERNPRPSGTKRSSCISPS